MWGEDDGHGDGGNNHEDDQDDDDVEPGEACGVMGFPHAGSTTSIRLPVTGKQEIFVSF